MRHITLPNLHLGNYSKKDFEMGERIRIFINYSGNCTEIEVREGIVLDSQTDYLRMKVKKAGRVVNGKLDLKLGPYPYRRGLRNFKQYTRNYSYGNIGLIKKLN